MTQRSDGEWHAIEPHTLFRAQRLGTEVYRDTLAARVQALGYEISERGEWELQGYDRAVIMQFSQRRAAIEQDLADHGIRHTAESLQLGAYRTRAEKIHVNEHELRAKWHERAQSLGLDVHGMTERAYDRQHEHERTQQQYERTHQQKYEWTMNDAPSHDRDNEERKREHQERQRAVQEQGRGWGWSR